MSNLPFFVFAYFKLLEEFIGCVLGSKSKTAYDSVLNIIQSNLTSTSYEQSDRSFTFNLIEIKSYAIHDNDVVAPN